MARSDQRDTPVDDEVESLDDKIATHVERIRSALAVEPKDG